MELTKRTEERNGAAGFSLVEAMIALFLLTFGLLALASTQVPPVRLNTRSQSITQAIPLAYGTLERITKDRTLGADLVTLLASPTVNADISAAEPTAYQVTPTPPLPPLPRPFTRTITHSAVGATTYPRLVTVAITWMESGVQRRIAVASIVR